MKTEKKLFRTRKLIFFEREIVCPKCQTADTCTITLEAPKGM